jgi:hypothetical protein
MPDWLIDTALLLQAAAAAVFLIDYGMSHRRSGARSADQEHSRDRYPREIFFFLYRWALCSRRLLRRAIGGRSSSESK